MEDRYEMKTKVWAHRGASAYAPENTLEAFLLAAEQGADGVELDVQLTKDGEMVVVHDEEIDRVSDGSGFVKDYTLAELKTLNFNKTHPEYQDVKIPTLREVYEALKPTGMTINVELKTGIFWYKDLEKKVLELTKEMEMEDRVIYSSFNHYSIAKILELDPKASTGILYADVIYDVVNYAKKIGTEALHPATFHVQMADFLQQYVESDLAVHGWTVNDKAEIERLMEAGVDCIKIEGRAKSAYYAAIVTGAYRHCIDAVAAGQPIDPIWRDEVEHVSHRIYSTGFYYGFPGQYTENSRYIREWQVCAIVESCDENGLALCSLRNKFTEGDELECVGPDLRPFPITAGSMTDMEGTPLPQPRTPQMQFYLPLPCQVPPYTILRRSVDLSPK